MKVLYHGNVFPVVGIDRNKENVVFWLDDGERWFYVKGSDVEPLPTPFHKCRFTVPSMDEICIGNLVFLRDDYREDLVMESAAVVSGLEVVNHEGKEYHVLRYDGRVRFREPYGVVITKEILEDLGFENNIANYVAKFGDNVVVMQNVDDEKHDTMLCVYDTSFGFENYLANSTRCKCNCYHTLQNLVKMLGIDELTKRLDEKAKKIVKEEKL